MKPYFRTRIALAILLILTLGAPALSAAGSREGTAPKYTGTEGRITVYLSGPEAMLKQLESTFEAKHGDVLDLVQMGCGPLRQRVWTEHETGTILADVVWGSDPLVYIALDKDGALEPYTPNGYDMLKDVYKVEGNYTLVNERYGVVLYNPDLLGSHPAPDSLASLLDGFYKDRIAHSDPQQSSTALSLVAGIWDLTGRDWEYHKQLVANGLLLARKNSDVPNKIIEGEFLAGITAHDEAFRLIQKAKKEGYPASLAVSWPIEGCFAIQRPIAITTNPTRPAQNQQIARDFVDYMISSAAQKITRAFAFVSVRSDVPLPEGVPANLDVYRVDWTYLSDHQEEIQKGFNELF